MTTLVLYENVFFVAIVVEEVVVVPVDHGELPLAGPSGRIEDGQVPEVLMGKLVGRVAGQLTFPAADTAGDIHQASHRGLLIGRFRGLGMDCRCSDHRSCSPQNLEKMSTVQFHGLFILRPGDNPLDPRLPLVPRDKSHPHFHDTEYRNLFGNLFKRLGPGRAAGGNFGLNRRLKRTTPQECP